MSAARRAARVCRGPPRLVRGQGRRSDRRPTLDRWRDLVRHRAGCGAHSLGHLGYKRSRSHSHSAMRSRRNDRRDGRLLRLGNSAIRRGRLRSRPAGRCGPGARCGPGCGRQRAPCPRSRRHAGSRRAQPPRDSLCLNRRRLLPSRSSSSAAPTAEGPGPSAGTSPRPSRPTPRQRRL